MTVLVPLALCLMVVSVITAEWLIGNLGMTLAVYGEFAYRKKRERESILAPEC